jgi:hypothetical protein
MPKCVHQGGWALRFSTSITNCRCCLIGRFRPFRPFRPFGPFQVNQEDDERPRLPRSGLCNIDPLQRGEIRVYEYVYEYGKNIQARTRSPRTRLYGTDPRSHAAIDDCFDRLTTNQQPALLSPPLHFPTSP